MKTILNILLILLSINATAQCKFRIDEVNEFTEVSKTATKYQWLGGSISGGEKISFRRVNEHLLIDVYITSNYSSRSVREGDELYLILDNDEKVVLKNLFDDLGNYNTSFYSATATYDITEETLEKLSNHTIVKYRMNLWDSYVERKAGKNKALKVKDSAGCLLNH